MLRATFADHMEIKRRDFKVCKALLFVLCTTPTDHMNRGLPSDLILTIPLLGEGIIFNEKMKTHREYFTKTNFHLPALWLCLPSSSQLLWAVACCCYAQGCK